ncbi:hypothetical protein HPB50_027902 [Hyalomma asiaticum]|nr:hypothetical protein HPB50_027902 [Hyalomma asiaticum]
MQGILGNYAEERSSLPVFRAMCRYSPLSARGRRSFCALQHRLRLPRSACFGWSMLSELVGRAPCSA